MRGFDNHLVTAAIILECSNLNTCLFVDMRNIFLLRAIKTTLLSRGENLPPKGREFTAFGILMTLKNQRGVSQGLS